MDKKYTLILSLSYLFDFQISFFFKKTDYNIHLLQIDFTKKKKKNDENLRRTKTAYILSDCLNRIMNPMNQYICWLPIYISA